MEGSDKDELTKAITKAFIGADEERKGFLTKEDYKVAVIQLLGYKPSKHEVLRAWSEEVGEGEGLTLNQFSSLMLPRLVQRDSSEHVRQIFLAFDRFCRGFISLDDCKAAFAKVRKLKNPCSHCLCIHIHICYLVIP